jgi:hypothetical protein
MGRPFTNEEDQFLLANYKEIPAKRMAKMLGRTEGTARQRMKLLGITVPPEIVERFKWESQFQKGHIPLNKGKKLSEYCSKAAIRKIKRTQFKKGNLPHNSKNNLDISTRKDKRGVPYLFIRISLSKWIPLLHYNWEEQNGPVPKGFNLIHKDGNTMNCDASNGLLLSNADLMRRNSYQNYPVPIAKAIQLLGALQRQINKRQKQHV